MILSYSVSDPIIYHVYCSGCFLFCRSIYDAFVAVLSVATGVGGRECSIYARAVRMDVAFWKFSNNPPNSASMADAMAFIVILHYTCTV